MAESRSIIDRLCDDSVWDDFLKRKSTSASKEKAEIMEDFIVNRRYRGIVESIRNGTYTFKPVRRIEIPKPDSEEKRVVYSCKRKDMTEHMVLRVLADLLQDYDAIFQDNLYSFRNEGGVQKAVARLRAIDDIGSMYAYKADITKYFNSVDQKKMISIMKKARIDKGVIELIGSIIGNPEVEFEGEIIIDEKRGIMPGLPFSTFLSNLYLNDIDIHFKQMRIQYYRFADDILILSNSKEELNKHVGYVRMLIKKRNLVINPDKEIFYRPHDRIEFLGLFIQDGSFDLNRKSLDRTMKKIRMEGRHYRKLVEIGEKTTEESVHCFLTRMDQRFFGWEKNSKACWTHWYFPLINTDKSLKIIDNQIQEWCRFIVTGKHVKGNLYCVSYQYLKGMGYQTLVNRFYNRRYKSESEDGVPCRT
ncbi:reverse transcriptase [methanogenic archaeon mixed culture ISO4-G1]|nr:reverse transcriptase [methanogenic archaeon mixed culture ISO4-G1]